MSAIFIALLVDIGIMSCRSDSIHQSTIDIDRIPNVNRKLFDVFIVQYDSRCCTSNLDSQSICRSHLFSCDTTRCISREFVCNNEYNCHDRTDENHCFNMSKQANTNICHRHTSIVCEQTLGQIDSPLDENAQLRSICIER
jgi:hypothetical protein